MKRIRILVGIFALSLCMLLLAPCQAHAQESTGYTTLETRIPEFHIVQLEIGSQGSVFADGKAYTHKDQWLEVERLKEQTYIIQPDAGWKVDAVYYGLEGQQTLVKLKDNSFTAPAIHEDGNILTVIFKQVLSDDGSGDGSGNGVGGSESGGNGSAKDESSSSQQPSKEKAEQSVQVKTGDESQVFVWMFLLVVCVLSIAYIKMRHKVSEV